ncbi:hypothetical protein BDQ17DRAFT_1339180 [Cyathus striatus]|nr:hypothetical protein BDQ17DRAFT_1339180 [Cyathus striatus]
MSKSNITEESNDHLLQAIYSHRPTDVDYESNNYYYGLPSKPISVFHIGATFQMPTGFEAYRVPKTIMPVFDDKFAAVLGLYTVPYTVYGHTHYGHNTVMACTTQQNSILTPGKHSRHQLQILYDNTCQKYQFQKEH